jgi:hypothetical protein
MASLVTPDVLVNWSCKMSDSDLETLQSISTVRASTIDLGTVLPKGDDPRAAHAGAHKREDEYDWYIHYFLPPDSDPPKGIIETDQKIGGPDRLAEILSSIRSFGTARANLRIDFELDATRYKTELIPQRQLPPAVTKFASDAVMEQVGFRFDAAPFGIREVIFILEHNVNRYFVSTLAVGTVAVGTARSVPFASTIAEHIKTSFFTEP